MALTTEFAKKLNNLRDVLSANAIRKLWQTTVNANPEDAADLTREQLARGEASSGKRLPTYRSKKYVASKRPPRTAPGGRMNLLLTGAFYRSIQVKAQPKKLTFLATDPKAEDLDKRFGDPDGLLKWNLKTIANLKNSELFLIFKKNLNAQLKTN